MSLSETLAKKVVSSSLIGLLLSGKAYFIKKCFAKIMNENAALKKTKIILNGAQTP